ncbi:hypothetical protein [Piscinibacter gummiphilus]|uniref:hypothetical protein n=1 Tax=Piscinibacter gummiphilus TaxID=946333 RepID=UPI0012F51672|nr:hypothetical protein [Piscinibacter gummiphilus]GLS94434.1 hypothetical protein GCM10007918_17260 [Piscinibacter gummiphilus]
MDSLLQRPLLFRQYWMGLPPLLYVQAIDDPAKPKEQESSNHYHDDLDSDHRKNRTHAWTWAALLKQPSYRLHHMNGLQREDKAAYPSDNSQ